MSTKRDGEKTVLPFEVVHDIYEVLHRYPAGTPLRERLQRYRERLQLLGRSSAEIDARLAKWSCPDLADRFDCLNQLGALVSNSMGDT